MSKRYQQTFEKILLKWQLIRALETVLLVAAFTVPVHFMSGWFLQSNSSNNWFVSAGFFLISGLVLTLKKGIFNASLNEVFRYLNHRFPQLEHSAEIVAKDERELTAIESIQKQRIETRIAEAVSKIKIPHSIGIYLSFWVFALVIFAYLPNSAFKQQAESEATENHLLGSVENAQKQQLPPEITKATVTLRPPAYTRLPAQTSDQLALDVPENSFVSWELKFSGEVENAYLIFDHGDSLKMQKRDALWVAEKRLLRNGFYFIRWHRDHKMLQSPYYPIRVEADEPPIVEITQPGQYLELQYAADSTIELAVQASDDYGLSDAHIVATVSRGSGEAVKFREQKLFFEEPLSGNPRDSRLKKTINIRALGMAPGDELYYYIVAQDNKVPQGNTARTDTYFINVPDTAQNSFSIAAGLGVDQMPAYFRSQRQIIIDTEAIIREAPDLARKEYQERLNKLGIDQKLLRLRYGQFLGEEFESGISENIDILVQEQNRDHDHEHGSHGDHHHHHEHGEVKEEALLESYMHIHDYQGEATFFDDAIKAQLKAALAQMWEAELRLRTFRPKEALPYEFKALELIKDVQQKSRVYVERIGFEPPVLKPEENRLTGALDEISSQRYQSVLAEEAAYSGMRAALDMVEPILQKRDENIPLDHEILNKAALELAGLAIEEPGEFIKPLTSFRVLLDESSSGKAKLQHLEIIRKAMHQALPSPPTSPYKKTRPMDGLNRQFQLELSKEFNP